MRTTVFLLVLLFLAVAPAVRITKTALVDDEFFIGIGNRGERLEGVSVTLSFPELGYRYVSSASDLASGETTIKRLLVGGLPAGDYYVRVSVANDNFHRTKHRLISIIQ